MNKARYEEVITRLNLMEAEIRDKAMPTGVTVVGGLPEFKYNKTVTSLLDEIIKTKAQIILRYKG